MKPQDLQTAALNQEPVIYNLETDMFSVRVDPLDRATYKGEHEIVMLGSLSIARITTGAAIISRKKEEIQNPAFKSYSFVVIFEGEMMLSHERGTAELKKGQFMFIDNNSPRTMFVEKSISVMIISVPAMVLDRHFHEPESYQGMVLNCIQNNEHVFNLILDSWDKIKAGSLREFAPYISERLLRRVALVYTMHVNHKHNNQAKRINAAKELIEEQLSNPDLSVQGLADEIGISSRYLRSLFSNSEKISHYILRRRLEESAQFLSDARNDNMLIKEIALNFGFNNLGYFCRIFKRVYKVTPGEYRKLRQC